MAVVATAGAGKPADRVDTVYLTADFPQKRRSISSASNRRGLAHRPRRVEVTSNGVPVRVSVLDLGRFDDPSELVRVMLEASGEVERGGEPSTEALVWSAVSVREARFRPGGMWSRFWPWAIDVHYLVIVTAEVEDLRAAGETQVAIETSYGR